MVCVKTDMSSVNYTIYDDAREGTTAATDKSKQASKQASGRQNNFLRSCAGEAPPLRRYQVRWGRGSVRKSGGVDR